MTSKTEDLLCFLVFFVVLLVIIFSLFDMQFRCESKFGYIWNDDQCELIFDYQKKMNSQRKQDLP